MKIRRETLPLGENKDTTALPQSPLYTKTGAKNGAWVQHTTGHNGVVD